MDLFGAIAERHRRQIIALLNEAEHSAGELVAAIRLSQPAVSKHLKCLREAGLVRVRSDGQRRLYRIEPRRLAELDAWLEPYRRFWRDPASGPASRDP
jgi:DNA-binding transcriptional ArsR family regulator